MGSPVLAERRWDKPEIERECHSLRQRLFEFEAAEFGHKAVFMMTALRRLDNRMPA